MWWRKRQLAGTQKFESFRRVLRRSYLWRSFGSLEGLSGLPSNNQGGIQVPWWCNTQLNSIVKFRNENYKRHINSNWRNWWFCVGAPRRPPAPNKELCRHHQVIWCYLRDMIGSKDNSFCSLRVAFFPVAFLSIFAKICIFVQQLIFKHDIRCSINCITLRIDRIPRKI